MGTENEIDQLFKRGLEEPDIPFNVMDWEKMARKLDEKQKKKILPFWVYTASGIAAAVLIFLFWFLSGPSVSEKGVKNPLTAQKGKEATRNALPGRGTDTLRSSRLAATQNQGELPATEHAAPYVSELPAAVLMPNEQLKIRPFPGHTVVFAPLHTTLPLTDSAILADKALALARSRDPLEKIHHTEIAKSVREKMEDAISARPALILSAMAAPDISSGPSGSNRSSKVSTNLGLLGTYALGARFSLTSGAIYAKKYYNYGAGPGSNIAYTPPAGTDLEIKADCNVIDIPLNVNYKVLDKKKLSVSVNTGLSSYFMLKEKYDYVITRPNQAQQVSTTEINNKNQHVFGIANVSVSFDHQISENVSVGVQPFTKLPLTGIGNYDVNLKSTGVSFSLSIGLFPSKKPGKLAANRYSSLY